MLCLRKEAIITQDIIQNPSDADILKDIPAFQADCPIADFLEDNVRRYCTCVSFPSAHELRT
jgi:Trk K+ transport system NAD-binding subunit